MLLGKAKQVSFHLPSPIPYYEHHRYLEQRAPDTVLQSPGERLWQRRVIQFALLRSLLMIMSKRNNSSYFAAFKSDIAFSQSLQKGISECKGWGARSWCKIYH